MSEIKHSTESTFIADISQKDVSTIVYFWAEWCNPCKQMSQIYEEFAKSRDNVITLKVDVDANQSISQQFNIMSIPTLLLIKNGQVVAQHTGSMALKQLQEFSDN